MSTHYNSNLKTARSRTAQLLMALYDSGRTTFTIADAARITGLTPPLASSLLHKASKRGLVSRLKRGLFVIVPRNSEVQPNILGIPISLHATWPVRPPTSSLMHPPWSSTAW